MKFSHSLLFSTVPEWQSSYLSYDSLKATIYKLEKDQAQLQLHQQPLQNSSHHAQHPAEAARLLQPPSDALSSSSSLSDSDRAFLKLLRQELAKIEEFYLAKEHELSEELNGLVTEIERIEKVDFELVHDLVSQPVDEEDEDDEEENSEEEHGPAAQPRQRRFSLSTKRQQLLKLTKFGILPILGLGSKPTKHPAQPQRPSRPLIDVDSNLEHHSIPKSSPTSPVHGSSNFKSPRSRHTAIHPKHLPGADKQPQNAAKHTPHHPSPSSVPLNSPSNTKSSAPIPSAELAEFWASSLEFVHDSRVFFKRRLTQSFLNLSALKAYVDLNYTGFRKIVKKYDKVFESGLSARFMEELLGNSKTFGPTSRQRIEGLIEDQLVPVYARVVTMGDLELARKQLKAHLREQLVWERNTIWRDMIGLERKGWANSSKGVLDKPFVRHRRVSDDANSVLDGPLPSAGFGERVRYLARWKVWRKLVLNYSVFWSLVASLGFLCAIQLGNFKSEAERNCLAMLVFVIVLWTSEALPLFVTGMFVPLLVVVLRVIKDADAVRLDASHAAVFVFAQMLSPTIILLLGAFTLAAVLSKHNIDKVMAAKMLSFAGTKPRAVLLAYMGVTCFASMWISNVAAPVLSYSLAQPILRTIPTRSPYARSLVLGIALAADIGGQASPIASPQNLIALSYMEPGVSWLVWFAVAVPVASLSVVATWMILTWAYEREFTDSVGLEEPVVEELGASASKAYERIVYIKPIPAPKEPFSLTQWSILAVGLLTIVMWCVEKQMESKVGDMGVIALVPMIVYFGTGLLRKSDFDNFPWSIVFLAMSGIALGKSVLSSGLLSSMDLVIEKVLNGFSLWPVTILFGLFVLIVATFISHTVASVLLIPIAKQVGENMIVPHPRLIIFITTLICSNGMGLPVSSFPNQTAINLEDSLGQRYLRSGDFLKFGLSSSLICFGIDLSVGYLISIALGL